MYEIAVVWNANAREDSKKKGEINKRRKSNQTNNQENKREKNGGEDGDRTGRYPEKYNFKSV